MALTDREAAAPQRRGVGAGVAYLLAVIVLLLGGFAAWALLGACGVSVFGKTYQFPWCEARIASLNVLRDEEARNRAMRDRVHDAELALLTPEACGPPVEPVREPEPAPEPEPVEEAALCEPGSEPLPPPQRVALVLDGSGSMEYSVDVPVELEAQYLRAYRAMVQAQRGAGGGSILEMMGNAARINELIQQNNSLDQQLRAVPGRSRAEMAREVLRDVVRQAPDALTLDLTTFSDCTEVTTRSYGPGQRDSAVSRINQLRPQGGTPLARSMEQAAQSLQSQAEDAERVTMVLVTDGNDSCQGDPCATARRLKERMPNLSINVVDLSQTEALQCIAAATGGTYSRTRGADIPEFNDMVEDAAGYGEGGRCAPAE